MKVKVLSKLTIVAAAILATISCTNSCLILLQSLGL